MRLAQCWVRQAGPGCVHGAQGPPHLGHDGHLAVRRRRRAGALSRGPAALSLVGVVGGRGACLARLGASVAFSVSVSVAVAVAVLLPVAVLALGAARVLFGAAAVGVG